MSAEFDIFAAFLIGISGGLHCMAMCGGISAALGYATEQNKTYMFLYALAYNIGRIVSYALIGLLFGGLLSIFDSQSALAHRFLKIVSSILLIAIGLKVSGVLLRFDLIEKAGFRIWVFVQPLALKFFPINSLFKALGFGLLWGWLPCGLVYSTLAWSASSASFIKSALLMAVFGLGTLPWLLASTLAGQQTQKIASTPGIKRWLGIMLVLMGVYGLINPHILHSTEEGTQSQEHHQHH